MPNILYNILLSLSGLYNLTDLDLEENYLEVITFGSLHGMPRLEELWLWDNDIYSIEPNAFIELGNLRELGMT